MISVHNGIKDGDTIHLRLATARQWATHHLCRSVLILQSTYKIKFIHVQYGILLLNFTGMTYIQCRKRTDR